MNSRFQWLLSMLVVAALLFLVGHVSADQFDSVRNLIRRKLEQRESPSITVAVGQGGRIIWEEAFGWADKENKLAATVHTPYRLGSVSKPITATAVMVAHARGQLNLDRPVNDYLGKVKLRAGIGTVSDVTVRRVIQHMAGLPEYGEAYYRDEAGQMPSLNLVVKRYGIVTRLPGEKFVYSNLGYAVLGNVLQHVAGNSYSDSLHKDVFVPLGMTNSAVPGPHLSDKRAVGYTEVGMREVDYVRSDAPAADVHASAHDLARFGLFHLKAHLSDQQPILSDKSIDEMQLTTVPMDDAQYGLGWHIRRDYKGRRQVLHGGAAAGVDAQFTLIPMENLCVVVLANVTRHYPGAVTEAVTNAIMSTLLGGQPEDFPVLRPLQRRKGLELPGKLEGKWAGVVQTHQENLDTTIWFKRNGEIQAQLGQQAIVSMRESRLDGNTFTGKMDGDIGTDDARRRAHELEWDLTIREGAINGTVYATALPLSKRPLRLGYWVSLRPASDGR